MISEALEAAEATGEADMATHRQVASEVTTEVLAAALGESWEKSAAPPVAMEVLAAALGESPEKSAAPPVAMEVETETVQKSAPARSEMETPASTFVMEEEPEYKAPPSVKVPVKVRKMPMAPPILKARVKESSLCDGRVLWRQVSLGQAMRPECGRPRLASAAARAACATKGRWQSGGAVCG